MKSIGDPGMKRIPIVIDTDPGVDDFFCLALACARDDIFDLKAVCTMGGNNYTDVTTQNALDILGLFRKNDIPVARGADSYLTEKFDEPVAKFHGENGLGNIIIPHSDRSRDMMPAWDKLYEIAREAAGELVLVTVAPLTNVAMALEKYPDLPEYIKKIVMMGGTITTGNITPYAEANVGHDAEASDIVFSSGIPIDMIGLNVTRICPIREDVFDRFGKEMDPLIRDVMKGLIRFRNGEALHDVIALSTLVDSKLMTWEKGTVRIELQNYERKGQTVFIPGTEGKTRVAVAVDPDRYDSIIGEMLLHL